MKFFKQIENNTCNIIAIQTVLSFFNQYSTFKEIEKELPKHSFGNTLKEIQTYLNKRGIKTKLFSDISKKDIKINPIIVNVDAVKIRRQKGKQVPHYVVLLKEGKDLYLYDGASFKRKVKRSFEEIYNSSLDMNRFHENGMWLVTK
ncbi:MAG: C39 family peptidase [Candidatus Pacearchaeota archaeon]|nr:C39 family peptidase [Candidatus Pacearchaeota archaeon]